MIAAVISNKIGFDFVYGSGFWMTASAYGLPDAGIATYTQMLDRMATLTRTVNASVIADADTGYGGLLNVHHTVRGYEAAGVAAIQIEDQEFPKKCGHTPFKRVVPVHRHGREGQGRLRGADRIPRRRSSSPAPTRARPTVFEGAVKRGIAYGEAGADVVFLEALESEAEMREACARISQADDGQYGGRRQNADLLEDGTGGDRLQACDFSFDDGPCRGRCGRKRTTASEGGGSKCVAERQIIRLR